MKACKKCNKPWLNSMKFCGVCGLPLNKPIKHEQFGLKGCKAVCNYSWRSSVCNGCEFYIMADSPKLKDNKKE